MKDGAGSGDGDRIGDVCAEPGGFTATRAPWARDEDVNLVPVLRTKTSTRFWLLGTGSPAYCA